LLLQNLYKTVSSTRGILSVHDFTVFLNLFPVYCIDLCLIWGYRISFEIKCYALTGWSGSKWWEM